MVRIGPAGRPGRGGPAGGHAIDTQPDATGPSGHDPVAEPRRLTNDEELELLERARAGDGEALATLLGGYQRRIFAVCHRMLGDVDRAEDLTQDSLVRVIEGLEGYTGSSKLSTWVIRVTMNTCLSHLRGARLRRHGSLDAPGEADEGPPTSLGERIVDDREPPAARNVERDERLALVEEALASIDPDMRAILVLRDLQDLEYQEIGAVLGVPVGTVKSRIFRARAALRTAMEALEGDDEPDAADDRPDGA